MPSARRTQLLNTIAVDDLEDPRLEPYRNQKDAWLRSQRDGGTGIGEGLFLAEGELVVRALLDSGHQVVSVLCTPSRLEAMGESLGRLDPATPVFVADRPVLERIVGFDLHRGILAAGRRAQPPTAADIVDRAGLLVLCEDLTNHDNMGSIFRNVGCLIGGADPKAARAPAAVLLSPRCCDPLYRKSLRVSMGHVLRVPFARLEPWPKGLGLVRAAGFEIAALTPSEPGIPVTLLKHNPHKRAALLVGTEGAGLGAGSLALADARVRIPMAPGADSLNVATALAIALSHLRATNPDQEEPAGPWPSQ
ncbi:MAG TPA: RNA methyltransferase [Phycisphaerales bacterium]|nr:RNA methyltransferase [Phycisphaerales bacterium]